jgi:sec-independent protein translocase protein TatC
MASRDENGLAARSVKPFVEHLEDLRRTLIWSLAALTAGILIAIPLAPRILTLLKIPLRQVGKDPEQFLRVIEVTGGLSIAMSVVIWSGVLISAPLIVFCVARFVFPGLTRRERQAVLQSVGFAVALFALGVVTGYVLLLRVTLLWMFQINAWIGVQADFVQVTDYVSFVLKLLLALGLTFEFPVVVLVLAKLGLVTARFLASKRRHVVITSLFVSAVITPTVDPVSQVVFATPLYILYEMCIWMTWLMERRARRGSEPARA